MLNVCGAALTGPISASYEVFLANIGNQQDFVEYLESIEGVRKVNASNLLA